MNEQTIKLISELATKLGVTAEHLWGALVRQAQLSAVTSLITSAALVALVLMSYRFVRRKTGITKGNNHAEWEADCGGVVAWIVWGIVAAIALLCVLCDVDNIVAGFFNPEYWALRQLIK